MADLGDPIGTARSQNNLGWCLTLRGDHAEALGLCVDALAAMRRLRDRFGEATTLDTIGHACLRLGRTHDAIACYRDSHALFHELGDRFPQADVLVHLGDAHETLGETDEARSSPSSSTPSATASATDSSRPKADRCHRWRSPSRSVADVDPRAGVASSPPASVSEHQQFCVVDCHRGIFTLLPPGCIDLSVGGVVQEFVATAGACECDNVEYVLQACGLGGGQERTDVLGERAAGLAWCRRPQCHDGVRAGRHHRVAHSEHLGNARDRGGVWERPAQQDETDRGGDHVLPGE
ncbi:tetratricopeptide repeat protein [Dactylosporangium sp. NPDC000244]|uniref:tetratricopeptide repeat protein n=1 Tax=Dactylosporangium sp. NPDC000244 TaxID=3154365 RepID=UPI00331A7FF7